VLKLTPRGELSWQKRYVGSGNEHVRSVREVPAGGYVLAGFTVSLSTGDEDAWAVRLGSEGAVLWHRVFGGPGTDSASFIQPTLDGGFILQADTASFGAGSLDVWLLKLLPDGGGTALGRPGSFQVQDTAVTPVATTATPVVTTAAVAATTASAVETQASVAQQSP
jgi:hypothetical protein